MLFFCFCCSSGTKNEHRANRKSWLFKKLRDHMSSTPKECPASNEELFRYRAEKEEYRAIHIISNDFGSNGNGRCCCIGICRCNGNNRCCLIPSC